MNNKEVWARPGMKCACVAVLGSHRRSNFYVCVDCSILPSGRCMARGRVSGLIFLIGDSGILKFPVATASAMAWLTSFFYFGCVEQGLLLWRFYALYRGFVC